MSNNDEKEGGILLGGISFGVGPSPSDDAADDKTAEMPAPITEEPPLGAPPEDAVATEAGGVREQQPLMC